MKSTDTGIKRILKAFKYSYDGFIASFKSEIAFRQDCLVFIIGIFFVFLFPFSYIERALLTASLLLILIMELVNTAIETIIDRISDDYHELSKKSKDIGSLLVLLSFINLFVILILIIIK